MTNRTYSPETKAAVMAALLDGQSVNKVSADYNIPRGTVAGWSASLERGQTVSNEKKAEIGKLLEQYLIANIEALSAQAKVFATPEWIALQNASEAAVLHGVMMDKAIRLIEAFQGENDQDKPTAD